MFGWFLLSLVFSCSAGGDTPPATTTLGAINSPVQSDISKAGVEATPPCECSAPQLSVLVQDQQQEALWRKEVQDLLEQLVQVQRDASAGQAEVLKLLGILGTQGSQQIVALQNMARHQSLLGENHQALLLQTSRIATHLQELSEKPAAPPISAPSQ